MDEEQAADLRTGIRRTEFIKCIKEWRSASGNPPKCIDRLLVVHAQQLPDELLDAAVEEWAISFGINTPWILEWAKKVLDRWKRTPQHAANRWLPLPSAASGWQPPPLAISVLGFNPQLETKEQAETRLMGECQAAIDQYLASAPSAPVERIRDGIEQQTPFLWLVRSMEGESPQQIAAAGTITERTVRKHIREARQELGFTLAQPGRPCRTNLRNGT